MQLVGVHQFPKECFIYHEKKPQQNHVESLVKILSNV